MARDGCSAITTRADASAADESELREVGVIAVEVINPGPERTRTHERIEIRSPWKQGRYAAHRLICVVASDNTGVVLEVVRFSNLRVQHQVHIAEHVRCENHQIRRLLEFTPAGIEIRHADGPLTSR